MKVEALINSYLVETESEQQRSFSIQLSQYPLLKIIQCLEDPLTEDDGIVRATATQCLSDLVKNKNDINQSEVRVLLAFLSDRLEDQDSTKAAAEGLTSLLHKYQKFISKDSTIGIFAKLKDYDMLNADIYTRYQIYLLLREISSFDVSPEFVDAFVPIASGEKDPRNLLISLSISRKILESIGDVLPTNKREEVYDITFCYFPVKFNPPKDMPYKITSEEIKNALSNTISSPSLAHWVVPGLISKLSAISIAVKLDTISALEETVDKLIQSGGIEEYWALIWEGVKFEVLHGTPESDTYGPVLKLLSKLNNIPEFIEAVRSEFYPEDIPKTKLYQLACLVIGVSTNNDVWNQLAPTAIQKCYEYSNILTLFLNGTYDIPHLDQIFQSLLTSHANGDKRDAVLGLKKIALSKNGAEYVSLVIQILTTDREYTALAEIAQVHPEAIQSHCIPALLADFPAPESLEALSKICCIRPLVHTLTVRLLSRVNTANEKETQLLLSTLIDSSAHLKTNEDLTGFNRVLIEPLLNIFADTKHQLSDETIESACILLERGSRGVTGNEETYRTQVLQFIDKLHFHLIFSSLVAMKEFPYPSGFLFSTVLPKLSKSANVLERAAYLRLFASAVNKWPDNENVFSTPLPQFIGELETGLVNLDANNLEVLTWVTKGLLCRNSGFDIAEALTNLASRNLMVAKAYGVLLVPDRTLIKENGCVVRPLYRQRLFINSLPIFLNGNDSDASLLAMSSLLKYSPQTVVKSHFDQVLPLLLSTLRRKTELLQSTAIRTISYSLPECAQSVAPELESVVPILLEIGTTAKSSVTRREALKGLISLRESLRDETDQYRELIKVQLKDSVGDPCRDVRRYAVKCRQIQF